MEQKGFCMWRGTDAACIPMMVTLALLTGCAGLADPAWDKLAGRNDVGAAPPAPTGSLAADLRIPRSEPAAPVAGPAQPIHQLVSAREDSGTPGTRRATAQDDGDPSLKLRTLYHEARDRYAGMDSYIVRFRRREQINGKDKPEELILAKFRKNPWSVYFKWLGPESKGREVIYVKGQYEDRIHTLVAAGDVPLMRAGMRFAVPPDNPLVTSRSRYSIRDSGVGPLIDHFGRIVAAHEKGEITPATLKYLGRLKRPEFDAACDAVEQQIPRGSEACMPHGGKRLWMFDPVTKLPVLVIAQDETGHEVEYYCYDLFQFPVKLDDADFNPDVLWKDKK